MQRQRRSREQLIFSGDVLAHPRLHDGNLIGIEIQNTESSQAVVLSCLDKDGTSWKLHFPHVVLLHFENFLAGNIIFEVRRSNVSDLNDTQLLSLYNLRNDDPDEARRIRNRFATKPAVLISSSYGCEGTIVLESDPESWTANRS